MSKKEVAKAQQTALDTQSMFEGHAGSGLENVGKNDILIPRLTILQALSPQLAKRDALYIEGAQAGDICDVGVSDIFEPPVIFLPVHFNKVWIEWAPRESGKGLVEIHPTDDIMAEATEDDRRRAVLPSGNYVAETAQVFGFNLSAGRRKCFISFASTQLKKARKWNTLALSEILTRPDGTEFTPPFFYRTYKLGTGDESNNQGNWVGWTVNRGEKLEDLGDGWQNTFRSAVEFADQIKAGEAKADQSDLEAEPSAGGSGDSEAM